MPLFQKGSRVGAGPDADRWSVVRKLGEGQFAEVYEVKDMHAKEDKRVRPDPTSCMPALFSIGRRRSMR